MRRLFALFVATLLFGGGWLLLDGSAPSMGWSWGDPTPSRPTTSASPTTTPSASDSPSGDPTPACNYDTRLESTLEAMGLTRGDVRVGNEVNWSLTPETAPRGAFSKSEIRNRIDLMDLIDQVNPSTARLIGRMLDQSLDVEWSRAMTSGSGWVVIQPIHPIELEGNFWLEGGKLQRHPSTSQPGEVLWVFVSKQCPTPDPHVLGIRAWCGNPVVWARK